MAPSDLVQGTTYTWDELGGHFEFKPNYLSAAGGMPVSKATDSLLLISHPSGGKSFDYKDYWDGDDLVYTGRGKVGDQERTGPNLDAAENRRALYAFEAAGVRRLKYLGSPRTVEERRGRAPDDNGQMRSVLQFRLRFPSGEGREFAAVPDRAPVPSTRGSSPAPARRARPFDPDAPPAPGTYSGERLEPEEMGALQEKAKQGHHTLLSRLQEQLMTHGWRDIEEIPAAIDLRGTSASGERVIFEAKTVTDSNETTQTRGALAQLLEYRLEHGAKDDLLCLVVDRELSLRRARLLDAFEIAVIVVSEDGWRSVNDWGSELLGVDTDREAP